MAPMPVESLRAGSIFGRFGRLRGLGCEWWGGAEFGKRVDRRHGFVAAQLERGVTDGRLMMKCHGNNASVGFHTVVIVHEERGEGGGEKLASGAGYYALSVCYEVADRPRTVRHEAAIILASQQLHQGVYVAVRLVAKTLPELRAALAALAEQKCRVVCEHALL